MSLIDNQRTYLALLDRLPSPDERKAIRERAKTTIRQVAEELHVSPAAVALWESGRHRPHKSRLAAYVALLDALRALDRP